MINNTQTAFTSQAPPNNQFFEQTGTYAGQQPNAGLQAQPQTGGRDVQPTPQTGSTLIVNTYGTGQPAPQPASTMGRTAMISEPGLSPADLAADDGNIYKPLYFTMRTFYKRLYRQMVSNFNDKFDAKETQGSLQNQIDQTYLVHSLRNKNILSEGQAAKLAKLLQTKKAAFKRRSNPQLHDQRLSLEDHSAPHSQAFSEVDSFQKTTARKAGEVQPWQENELRNISTQKLELIRESIPQEVYSLLKFVGLASADDMRGIVDQLETAHQSGQQVDLDQFASMVNLEAMDSESVRSIFSGVQSPSGGLDAAVGPVEDGDGEAPSFLNRITGGMFGSATKKMDNSIDNLEQAVSNANQDIAKMAQDNQGISTPQLQDGISESEEFFNDDNADGSAAADFTRELRQAQEYSASLEDSLREAEKKNAELGSRIHELESYIGERDALLSQEVGAGGDDLVKKYRILEEENLELRRITDRVDILVGRALEGNYDEVDELLASQDYSAPILQNLLLFIKVRKLDETKVDAVVGYESAIKDRDSEIEKLKSDLAAFLARGQTSTPQEEVTGRGAPLDLPSSPLPNVRRSTGLKGLKQVNAEIDPAVQQTVDNLINLISQYGSTSPDKIDDTRDRVKEELVDLVSNDDSFKKQIREELGKKAYSTTRKTLTDQEADNVKQIVADMQPLELHNIIATHLAEKEAAGKPEKSPVEVVGELISKFKMPEEDQDQEIVDKTFENLSRPQLDAVVARHLENLSSQDREEDINGLMAGHLLKLRQKQQAIDQARRPQPKFDQLVAAHLQNLNNQGNLTELDREVGQHLADLEEGAPQNDDYVVMPRVAIHLHTLREESRAQEVNPEIDEIVVEKIQKLQDEGQASPLDEAVLLHVHNIHQLSSERHWQHEEPQLMEVDPEVAQHLQSLRYQAEAQKANPQLDQGVARQLRDIKVKGMNTPLDSAVANYLQNLNNPQQQQGQEQQQQQQDEPIAQSLAFHLKGLRDQAARQQQQQQQEQEQVVGQVQGQTRGEVQGSNISTPKGEENYEDQQSLQSQDQDQNQDQEQLEDLEVLEEGLEEPETPQLDVDQNIAAFLTQMAEQGQLGEIDHGVIDLLTGNTEQEDPEIQGRLQELRDQVEIKEPLAIDETVAQHLQALMDQGQETPLDQAVAEHLQAVHGEEEPARRQQIEVDETVASHLKQLRQQVQAQEPLPIDENVAQHLQALMDQGAETDLDQAVAEHLQAIHGLEEDDETHVEIALEVAQHLKLLRDEAQREDEREMRKIFDEQQEQSRQQSQLQSELQSQLQSEQQSQQQSQIMEQQSEEENQEELPSRSRQSSTFRYHPYANTDKTIASFFNVLANQGQLSQVDSAVVQHVRQVHSRPLDNQEYPQMDQTVEARLTDLRLKAEAQKASPSSDAVILEYLDSAQASGQITPLDEAVSQHIYFIQIQDDEEAPNQPLTDINPDIARRVSDLRTQAQAMKPSNADDQVLQMILNSNSDGQEAGLNQAVAQHLQALQVQSETQTQSQFVEIPIARHLKTLRQQVFESQVINQPDFTDLSQSQIMPNKVVGRQSQGPVPTPSSKTTTYFISLKDQPQNMGFTHITEVDDEYYFSESGGAPNNLNNQEISTLAQGQQPAQTRGQTQSQVGPVGTTSPQWSSLPNGQDDPFLSDIPQTHQRNEAQQVMIPIQNTGPNAQANNEVAEVAFNLAQAPLQPEPVDSGLLSPSSFNNVNEANLTLTDLKAALFNSQRSNNELKELVNKMAVSIKDLNLQSQQSQPQTQAQELGTTATTNKTAPVNTKNSGAGQSQSQPDEATMSQLGAEFQNVIEERDHQIEVLMNTINSLKDQVEHSGATVQNLNQQKEQLAQKIGDLEREVEVQTAAIPDLKEQEQRIISVEDLEAREQDMFSREHELSKKEIVQEDEARLIEREKAQLEEEKIRFEEAQQEIGELIEQANQDRAQLDLEKEELDAQVETIQQRTDELVEFEESLQKREEDLGRPAQPPRPEAPPLQNEDGSLITDPVALQDISAQINQTAIELEEREQQVQEAINELQSKEEELAQFQEELQSKQQELEEFAVHLEEVEAEQQTQNPEVRLFNRQAQEQDQQSQQSQQSLLQNFQPDIEENQQVDQDQDQDQDQVMLDSVEPSQAGQNTDRQSQQSQLEHQETATGQTPQELTEELANLNQANQLLKSQLNDQNPEASAVLNEIINKNSTLRGSIARALQDLNQKDQEYESIKEAISLTMAEASTSLAVQPSHVESHLQEASSQNGDGQPMAFDRLPVIDQVRSISKSLIKAQAENKTLKDQRDEKFTPDQKHLQETIDMYEATLDTLKSENEALMEQLKICNPNMFEGISVSSNSSSPSKANSSIGEGDGFPRSPERPQEESEQGKGAADLDNKVQKALQKAETQSESGSAGEVAELLKSASEELKQLRHRYEGLSSNNQEKDVIIERLHMHRNLVLQRLDELGVDVAELEEQFEQDLEEVHQQHQQQLLEKEEQQAQSEGHVEEEVYPEAQLARAGDAEGQEPLYQDQEGLEQDQEGEKSPEELLAENEELLGALQSAAEEMKELRAIYSESAQELNHFVQNEDVVTVEDLLESKVDIKDEHAINKLLWDSFESIRFEKEKLTNRIRRMKRWSENQTFGAPSVSQEADEQSGSMEEGMEEYQPGEPIGFDENGIPFQGYDDEGNLVYIYDQEGNQVLGYDEEGEPFFNFDEDGNPISNRIDEGEEEELHGEQLDDEVIQEEGYPEEDLEEAESRDSKAGAAIQDEEDLSVEKLVELLLLTLHLIENIRSRAVDNEEDEPRRLDAIVEMIDNFERMGESEDGKFDLNAIFQVLMQRKQEAQSQEDQEGLEEEEMYGQEPGVQMFRNRNDQGEGEDEELDEEELQLRQEQLGQEQSGQEEGEFSGNEEGDEDDMSYETLKANFQRACELLEDKDHQTTYLQRELEDAITRLELYVGHEGEGEQAVSPDAATMVIELRHENSDLKEQNLELQEKLEGYQQEYSELQAIFETKIEEIKEKEHLIEQLEGNLEFFAADRNGASQQSKGALDREVARLMKENHELRSEMIRLHSEFEQKENEMTQEISHLVNQVEEVRSQGGSGKNIDFVSVRKMVENIKLQNEIRNRDMLVDQILQVLSDDNIQDGDQQLHYQQQQEQSGVYQQHTQQHQQEQQVRTGGMAGGVTQNHQSYQQQDHGVVGVPQTQNTQGVTAYNNRGYPQVINGLAVAAVRAQRTAAAFNQFSGLQLCYQSWQPASGSFWWSMYLSSRKSSFEKSVEPCYIPPVWFQLLELPSFPRKSSLLSFLETS